MILFYFICLVSAFAATVVDAAPDLNSSRDFWVWDLRVMPPASRKATATLRSVGTRSLIYVEDSLWQKNISPAFVNRLKDQLEYAVPAGALYPGMGIVPLEERLFGTLPRKVGADERLIVLFANLGQYKDISFDGFFNPYDQMSEKEAFSQHQQHSNESNIIYINGFRKTEEYTTGVIAHELQHLLASGSGERESWLSETLGEGAMLVTGFFGDQDHVDRFATASGKSPLVSPRYVQYGPQLLFSSFLIDTLPTAPNTALGFLTTHTESKGKTAVERLFYEVSKVPLAFDAIFSNFVGYVFNQAGQGASLPALWNHSRGIFVPRIRPYHTFATSSGELNGEVSPYSFLAIDLAQELSPTAVIQVQRSDGGNRIHPSPTSCAGSATVLWKPISPKRIAIYSVGCEPDEKNEAVQFRLKILDQPSLFPSSPFKFFR